MLPFLKPKTVAGLIISHRKADGGTETEHQEGNEHAALEACAEDLIRAMHAKDAKGVAAAWRAGADVMGPQDDDADFDAQNEKAAEYSEE